MNLSFTEEQEILRQSAREYLSAKLPKKLVRELEESEAGYSPQMWKEMADLGWMGLPFPELYGGSGLGFLDLAVLMEEMGRACLPGPYFSSVVLGGLPVLEYGSEEQKLRYLPQIARGEKKFTLAVAEAGGSDPASIATQAVPDGDGWAVSGTKLFVPFGHVADYVICLARAGSKAGPESGLFVLETDAASMKNTDLKSMAGKMSETRFAGARAGSGDVLGKPDGGWAMTARILETAAVASCCVAAGMAGQVLDMTVAYARERKQFDRPIGSFQAIQHYCADMFIDVEAMRLSAYHAAWRIGQGLPCAEQGAQARVVAIDAGERIVSLAHQIHAAIGVTMEYDLHHYTRGMKAALLAFGDAGSSREVVAHAMGL